MVDSLSGERNGTPSQKDTEKKIPNSDGLIIIATNIANALIPLVRNEKDLWWFVMEQYYALRHSTAMDADSAFLPYFALSLHDVEYTWGKVEPFVVQVSNPGVSYLCEKVTPVLTERFGEDVAEMTVAYAFSQYCLTYREVIDRVRLDFAVHFRDSCRSSGHFAFSDQWEEVVQKLGGD